MKLTPSDVLEVRKALLAARLAGVSNVVLTNGYVAGVHDAHVSAIFSPIKLSLDPAISIGIMKLADFEKRLTLFGEDVLVEGEVNDAKKARKLLIRGKTGKIEYRCTDERMITYPKTNADEPGIVVTLTKAEVALLSRGTKTLGGSELVLQIKRDGAVHLESHDTNQDRFELDAEARAVFVDEEAPYPYVNSFDASNNGAFLPLIENMVKDNDTAELVVMRTGNISLKVYGHDVFAVPKAQHGDD
jgi:hypothetical protein